MPLATGHHEFGSTQLALATLNHLLGAAYIPL